jgi:hypothetical protein
MKNKSKFSKNKDSIVYQDGRLFGGTRGCHVAAMFLQTANKSAPFY